MKSFAYGLYNTFDTLGRRRQRLLRQRDPTTAATDVGGATLPLASAGVRRRQWRDSDPTTAAADVCDVTLPTASTAASGGGQGRPGWTWTDGCPRGAPRASAVLIIKHPCNPKSAFCCIPIAIQLQAGFETVRHMPGIYAWQMPGLGMKD